MVTHRVRKLSLAIILLTTPLGRAQTHMAPEGSIPYRNATALETYLDVGEMLTGVSSFDSCDCCDSGEDAWRWRHWWHSSCGMVPHMPYDSPTRGTYYFRPYGVVDLFMQQEAVRHWGGDPRNPYSNQIFNRVYDELALEGVTAEEVPAFEVPPDAPAE